jgi:hypothetical protein
MSNIIDRAAVSQALAKAIAYKNCGKQDQAEAWSRKLVHLLACADILNYPESETPICFQNNKTH